jgi:hypothetical protein
MRDAHKSLYVHRNNTNNKINRETKQKTFSSLVFEIIIIY